MVPDYLIDLFTKTNVVHGYGTRQVEFNFMPPKPKTNFGKKSFSYRGAVAWNSLTSTAKSSKSLKSLKTISSHILYHKYDKFLLLFNLYLLFPL